MKNYYVVLAVRPYDYHENELLCLQDFKFQEINTSNIEDFLEAAMVEAKERSSFSHGNIISWQEVREA